MFINTCFEWDNTACDLFNVTRMALAMRNTKTVNGPWLMAWRVGGISGP